MKYKKYLPILLLIAILSFSSLAFLTWAGGTWCQYVDQFALTIHNSTEFELENISVEFEEFKSTKNNIIIEKIAPGETIRINQNPNSDLYIYLHGTCKNGTQFLNKYAHSDFDEMMGFCQQAQDGYYGPKLEITESCK